MFVRINLKFFSRKSWWHSLLRQWIVIFFLFVARIKFRTFFWENCKHSLEGSRKQCKLFETHSPSPIMRNTSNKKKVLKKEVQFESCFMDSVAVYDFVVKRYVCDNKRLVFGESQEHLQTSQKWNVCYITSFFLGISFRVFSWSSKNIKRL